MKKRLREKLPLGLRRVARRMTVRLVRSTIYLTKDVLNIATKNGLDLQREWIRTDDHGWHNNLVKNDRPDLSIPWGAQDFLFMMDLITDHQRRTSETPSHAIQCSIIIPVYNNVRYTFQCLRSLMSETDRDSEIIVVNDGSSDETERLLSYMHTTLQVLKNSDNVGFIKACNQGAAVARGKYLVFLNNDTVVQSGWLRHLVDTVESDQRVGAVGSMLLYPDGRLQEAGGIIWKDGDGVNYGKGGDPNERKFRFAREVDYCSAASLLIRRNIFEELGGFDERYSPAFYEDTDLCFGVRSLGYKVMYQPMSQVVHYEGATAGTDLGHGHKHYQAINRPKFVEKWRSVLEREHLDLNPDMLDEAANRQRGSRIIVFDHSVPTPDKDSGSLRTFEILKSLSRFARTVFVPVHLSLSTRYEDLLGKDGIEVVPRDQYKSLIKSGLFQIAVLSRVDVADEMFASIRRLDPQIKIVFDTVDLHFLRLAREYEHTGDNRFARESDAAKRREKHLAKASDQVWCVSPEDKQTLEREVPSANVRIIPNIHSDRERVGAFDERSDLLFIGNFNHRPNKDALSFYVNDILPRLRELVTPPKLCVVGSNMTREILEYASDQVFIAGYMPDVTPILRSSRVLIAPLRFGAGMKGKIGQALSYGLPVVTTSIGAEGFGLIHGQEAMIADDPAAFASAIFEAYTDKNLWLKLSVGGHQYIQENLSPCVVQQKLFGAIGSLVDSRLPRQAS